VCLCVKWFDLSETVCACLSYGGATTAIDDVAALCSLVATAPHPLRRRLWLLGYQQCSSITRSCPHISRRFTSSLKNLYLYSKHPWVIAMADSGDVIYHYRYNASTIVCVFWRLFLFENQCRSYIVHVKLYYIFISQCLCWICYETFAKISETLLFLSNGRDLYYFFAVFNCMSQWTFILLYNLFCCC